MLNAERKCIDLLYTGYMVVAIQSDHNIRNLSKLCVLMRMCSTLLSWLVCLLDSGLHVTRINWILRLSVRRLRSSLGDPH